ncbi:MAG TPA: phage tail assembly protein [Alphaproteobacteria bacterium]|nr:phage tail assembly protein [Alphaproteobacteria bacterium]
MSDTMNYRFKHTAKHQNREVTEIEVRAPTMRDLKAIDAVKGNMAKMAKIIEALTGMTQREIDDLHFDDIRGLGEVVVGLFGVVKPAAAT